MQKDVHSNKRLDDRKLLAALRAFRDGDFSARLPAGAPGIEGEIAEAFNEIVELSDRTAREFERLGHLVGKAGKIEHRATLPNARGAWLASVEAVNTLIADMVHPISEIARVIGAVAKGDLEQTMSLTIDGRAVRGEFLRIGKVVNSMVAQLASFASEVTRVALEVGTEGKLGGQAKVRGAAGTWRGLTDNVNAMAANLTGQVRNIAEVTTAVANGDLSKKITVDVKGEMSELKNTVNTMVDQLNSFASEVTRVAREVGSEGKLGGQAEVVGVAGTWKDLTDNVNFMAANLTNQVRNIADVTTAVAKGDLSRKIAVDAKGEILELKDTVNTMVDQLNSFASEVTRVAREVGSEGKLGGQAEVVGVAGTWKDLTDNVNFMAANLTGQVRNIADVTTAVARGDLSRKIAVDAKGEILELKDTVNTMVDQLNSFASEVTRVAREVGSEGKLGGQAEVVGVAGTWKDLTDNVNFMAANLTNQVRNIADVTTAVARGDLSRKITVDARGEILEVKKTVNTMVDQLNSFASEVTRVAKEVGTDGKLGGQAEVVGVGGTWKDLTDNVNFMAANLTNQVRNIADVTTAVAKGDLSRKITVDARGEILEVKKTVNTMVDQLNSFASEVTRVAKEVGTEGKLGGQAEVVGVGGTWKDLTDNVNSMAANLTGQVRNIADVTTAVARGDLSRKITVDVRGELLELKNTVNIMVDQLNSFASEVTRVAREVGTEGKLGGQAEVVGVGGTWKDLTDNVNSMAANLTGQVRNIADVTTAVARGDLSRKITVDARGEILELKETVNIMVDQLNSFASEVTRVAREVGTEGKLGGQANVRGVGGTWKDLTDNVNFMAANLTGQVRGIADVVTAVAQGDLKRKLAVEAKGEIESLAGTINGMIDTLAIFADQVTNVAHEVGIEGKLGGQARVPGASGIWRDLTDNVNQLAQNLTTQVRAIAEVSTAVTKGDLSRSITVAASGEVAALKDNINEMIRNLEDRTKQLLQAQKMEAIGQLTGGIAHDFNNLLAVIIGNLDLVKRHVDDAHPRVQRQLSAVRHAAERGSGLTRQLLAFSRRQRLSPDILDIAALVRGFEPLLKRAVGETIVLEVEFPDVPVVCEVDPTQLETALLNLAVNARDAMPAGGRLSIAVRAVEQAKELAASFDDAPIGPWHVVTVRDTGTGMPRAVAERAFEPFFTTKEIGKGSGLGLSQVYGFVRQSGGYVTLTSEVGQGSQVAMYLRPSSEPVAEHHVHADPADLKLGRGESVLLVEDEPSVLALGIEMLTDLGYHVLTASDASGALEILKRGDQVDIVFTDVVMPGGRTGVQLASEARELRPGIRILLTSGYTGEALARHQTETMPLIEKPFRQDELAAKLREILEDSRPEAPRRRVEEAELGGAAP